MPATRSLLERLRRGAAAAGRLSEHDLDDLRMSIVGNLKRILNSREAMAQACESYGLPDLMQIVNGVPERAREIEAAIERCIKEHEPRVSQVAVQHIPNAHGPMSACFGIRASVQAGKTGEEVWFETVVTASGRVKLT